MSKTNQIETSLDIYSTNLFSNDDYKKDIIKI